jgi:amino acid transporter
VVLGVIPRETLAKSTAPFADAASVMWGDWAGIVIAIAAIISSLGALNGWTLMLAQVPMAAAADGAMPSVFAKVSSRGVPAVGLVISVGLSTLLVLLETSGSGAMVAFYNLIVQLSTDAAMIPYVFCSVVEAVLFVTRRPLSRALRVGPFMPISLVAFVFSLGTIYGSGATAGMWALILVLLAAPVWVFLLQPPHDLLFDDVDPTRKRRRTTGCHHARVDEVASADRRITANARWGHRQACCGRREASPSDLPDRCARDNGFLRRDRAAADPEHVVPARHAGSTE